MRLVHALDGHARIELPDELLPDWLESILGGRKLASIGVELNVIANNPDASCFLAIVSSGGLHFGFRKNFNGGVQLIGSNPLKAVGNAVACARSLEGKTSFRRKVRFGVVKCSRLAAAQDLDGNQRVHNMLHGALVSGAC